MDQMHVAHLSQMRTSIQVRLATQTGSLGQSPEHDSPCELPQTPNWEPCRNPPLCRLATSPSTPPQALLQHPPARVRPRLLGSVPWRVLGLHSGLLEVFRFSFGAENCCLSGPSPGPLSCPASPTAHQPAAKPASIPGPTLKRGSLSVPRPQDLTFVWGFPHADQAGAINAGQE